MAGGDGTGLVHVGIDGTARKVFCLYIVKAGDLDIAEPEEGEAGFDDPGRSVGHIFELGLGGPVVVVVEVPLLQEFAELQFQGRALRDVCGDTDEACKVLAEVEDRLPFGRMDDLFDRKGLPDANVRGVPVDEVRGSFEDDSGGPVIGHSGPVLGLTVIDAAGDEHARAGLPTLIGDNDLLGAVFIRNSEFRDGGEGVIRVRGVGQTEGPLVPAVPEEDTNVVVLLQEVLDVIRAVLHVVFIIGDEGSQEVVPCLFAVDGRVEHAEAGDVKPCGGDVLCRLFQREGLPEFRRFVVLRSPDPGSGPYIAHFSGFEPAEGVRHFSSVRLNRHLDIVSGAGRQGELQRLAEGVQVGSLLFQQEVPHRLV